MSDRPRRLPSWAAEIRDALPERGPVDIVIPGTPSVRYLKLSRDQIDQAADDQAERHHRRRRRARQHLIRRAHQRWLGVKAAVGVFASVVVTLGFVWVDRGAGLAQLAQREQQLERRELAFQAYVEATSHLLEADNVRMAAQLKDLNIDPDGILAPTQPRDALGAGEDDDVVASILAQRLDSEQESMLLDNLDLHDFIRSLPQVSPVSDPEVASSFGLRRHPIYRSLQHHKGVDLVTDGPREILASQTGRVTFAGRNGGFGNMVEIRNDFGVTTRYAHLERFVVEEGDLVRAGEPIGVMGSTGLSTGPHLHYEIVVGGVPVEPLRTLSFARNALEKGSDESGS